MDIRVKYKIISEIIKSNDEEVLNAVKTLLMVQDLSGFWVDLNAEDQEAINEGLEQLDKVQYVSHNTVKDEIKNQFSYQMTFPIPYFIVQQVDPTCEQ